MPKEGNPGIKALLLSFGLEILRIAKLIALKW